MAELEWEIFKRTGSIDHYLMMKKREEELQGEQDEEI